MENRTRRPRTSELWALGRSMGAGALGIPHQGDLASAQLEPRSPEDDVEVVRSGSAPLSALASLWAHSSHDGLP